MTGKHERRGPFAWFGRKPSPEVTVELDNREARLTPHQPLSPYFEPTPEQAAIVEDLTRCVQIGWRSYPDHVDEQLDRLAAIARARQVTK